MDITNKQDLITSVDLPSRILELLCGDDWNSWSSEQRVEAIYGLQREVETEILKQIYTKLDASVLGGIMASKDRKMDAIESLFSEFSERLKTSISGHSVFPQ